MVSAKRFELAPGVDLEAIRAALGPELTLEPAIDRAEARLHLDTWEGRLFRAGWSLHAESIGAGGARLALGRLDEAALAVEEMSRVPAFAWELPEGALRNLLAPLVKARRLLPLVELGRAVRPYRVVGPAGRAMVGLEVDRISAGLPDGSSPPVELPATLEAVQLDDAGAFDDVGRLLEGCAGLRPMAVGPLGRALEALSRTPGDDICKLVLDLDGDARADVSLRRICSRLLAAIEATVQGTLLQVDVEFLHDLRVSARRSRAALSQLDKVFDKGEVAGFRADLRWIGDATGPARDLDVFLLRWTDLTRALGAADVAALRLAHDRLVDRREQVQTGVVAALDSPRFRGFVADWGRFLQGERGSGPHGARPTQRVARSRIRKRLGKVLRRGAALGPESPAADLHAMRLDCKKLRYLLEMFRSLHPADDVKGLLRSLKQFQDTLGDFNDLSIQQELLAEVREGLTDIDPATDRALDRLLRSLVQRQGELRRLFAGRFTRFAGAEVQAVFDRLLV